MFSKNIQFSEILRISSWRKIAIGTWRNAKDPSVYGVLELDVREALAYLEKIKLEHGIKMTLTHFVGKAVAETLKRHPDINCILRYGRLYRRKNIDVFFQVANDSEGKDLAGMVIREADKKTLLQIAIETEKRVAAIRKKGDPEYKKMKNLFHFIPGYFSAALISASSFLMYTFNLWTPLLGAPRDPFGSIMITNIGSLGLEMAFVPLVPYSRVPILLAVGAIQKKAIVEDDQIRVGQVVALGVTFDHRIIDGVHASQMAWTMRKIFKNPEKELS